MMKVVRNTILIITAGIFIYTVTESSGQEIFFKTFPGGEMMRVTFSTIAFFYTGLGLLAALLIGLLDRMALTIKIKKIEKEKQLLSAKCGELKSLLSEDRVEADA